VEVEVRRRKGRVSGEPLHEGSLLRSIYTLYML